MFDYKIDLTKEIMSGRRFNILLKHLSNESALGRIVVSRMDDDGLYDKASSNKPKFKMIKNNTKEIMSLKKFN